MPLWLYFVITLAVFMIWMLVMMFLVRKVMMQHDSELKRQGADIFITVHAIEDLMIAIQKERLDKIEDNIRRLLTYIEEKERDSNETESNNSVGTE